MAELTETTPAPATSSGLSLYSLAIGAGAAVAGMMLLGGKAKTPRKSTAGKKRKRTVGTKTVMARAKTKKRKPAGTAKVKTAKVKMTKPKTAKRKTAAKAKPRTAAQRSTSAKKAARTRKANAAK